MSASSASSSLNRGFGESQAPLEPPDHVEQTLQWGMAECAEFNRQGTLLAVGLRKLGCTLIYDVQTLSICRKLKAHGHGFRSITSVSWSLDGRKLATVGQDGRAFVWDVLTGQPERMVELPLDFHDPNQSSNSNTQLQVSLHPLCPQILTVNKTGQQPQLVLWPSILTHPSWTDPRIPSGKQGSSKSSSNSVSEGPSGNSLFADLNRPENHTSREFRAEDGRPIITNQAQLIQPSGSNAQEKSSGTPNSVSSDPRPAPGTSSESAGEHPPHPPAALYTAEDEYYSLLPNLPGVSLTADEVDARLRRSLAEVIVVKLSHSSVLPSGTTETDKSWTSEALGLRKSAGNPVSTNSRRDEEGLTDLDRRPRLLLPRKVRILLRQLLQPVFGDPEEFLRNPALLEGLKLERWNASSDSEDVKMTTASESESRSGESEDDGSENDDIYKTLGTLEDEDSSHWSSCAEFDRIGSRLLLGNDGGGIEIFWIPSLVQQARIHGSPKVSTTPAQPREGDEVTELTIRRGSRTTHRVDWIRCSWDGRWLLTSIGERTIHLYPVPGRDRFCPCLPEHNPGAAESQADDFGSTDPAASMSEAKPEEAKITPEEPTSSSKSNNSSSSSEDASTDPSTSADSSLDLETEAERDRRQRLLTIRSQFSDPINHSRWTSAAMSNDPGCEYVFSASGGGSQRSNIVCWSNKARVGKVAVITNILAPPGRQSGSEVHIHMSYHPDRALLCSVAKSGVIHLWSKRGFSNWNAYAIDFDELEDNEEYIEREDEFDNVRDHEIPITEISHHLGGSPVVPKLVEGYKALVAENQLTPLTSEELIASGELVEWVDVCGFDNPADEREFLAVRGLSEVVSKNHATNSSGSEEVEQQESPISASLWERCDVCHCAVALKEGVELSSPTVLSQVAFREFLLFASNAAQEQDTVIAGSVRRSRGMQQENEAVPEHYMDISSSTGLPQLAAWSLHRHHQPQQVRIQNQGPLYFLPADPCPDPVFLREYQDRLREMRRAAETLRRVQIMTDSVPSQGDSLPQKRIGEDGLEQHSSPKRPKLAGT